MYKGFNKKLQGHGRFQFHVGHSYQTETAALRKSGFHACVSPLAVLLYYPPIFSRYCIVEISGDVEYGRMSRVCGTKIRIVREISFLELIKEQLRKGI